MPIKIPEQEACVLIFVLLKRLLFLSSAVSEANLYSGQGEQDSDGSTKNITIGATFKDS
jgi:hypothetical protein